MINELRITITTSTDTRGDAKVLMVEQLEEIIKGIQGGREGGNSIIGDIEKDGYEVHRQYEIVEI